jgi:hypothetical protein
MRVHARPSGFPIGAALSGIGIVGGLGVRLLHLDRLPFPLCTFRAITGVPCMGCGSTRAIARLAGLDLVGALRVQPLMTVVALAIGLWGIVDVVLLARRRALRVECSAREMQVLGLALFVAALVNWAYLIVALR